MAVRPASLETPERDLRLATREPAAEEERAEQRRAGPAEELRTMRDRIEAARKLKPEGHDLHCLDCFNRGRDAALRTIEGVKGT